MPRRKKNEPVEVKETPEPAKEIGESKEEKVTENVRKSLKAEACPLCGGSMTVSYACNFEMMTTRAGWHMDFKPRMTFCEECSKKLLRSVNNWYAETKKTTTYDKW